MFILSMWIYLWGHGEMSGVDMKTEFSVIIILITQYMYTLYAIVVISAILTLEP